MEKRKTSKKLLFGWPTRTIAITVFAVMMGYATYFATDYMGLSTMTVGILFMVSKIFDGFTDVMAGYIIEKAHFRTGKGRPFELALIGYGLGIVLLYGAPKMGIGASYVYLFVMYTLINSGFLTLLNCAEPVYMSNAIEDPGDSVTLSSLCGLIGMVVSVAAGVVIPQLIKNLADTPNGWLKISAMVAVPCTLIGMIRFLMVKEKQYAEKKVDHQVTLKDMFQAITGNKYIIIFACIGLVSNIGSGIAGSVGMYYAQYIIGDVGAQSLISMATLSAFVGILMVQILAPKFGMVRIMKVMTVLGLIGYIARLFAPRNLMYVFATCCLATLAFTVMFSFVYTFEIDCMDYGEWKSGVRNEGAISCAPSVTSKIGTAIGAGMTGILMGISGYNGSLAVQSESANLMIIGMSTVIPAIFCVIQLILLHFYDLDKMIPQIRKELAEKSAK